jgi:serine/threonine protein kinase
LGHKLRSYALRSVLGRGGFGVTYLAQDSHLDQLVAIKEYLPSEFALRAEGGAVCPLSSQQDETYRWGLGRFLTEAQTLAHFDHPNILRVLSVFEQNNTAYMVMEYERGEELGAKLCRGELRDEAALLQIFLPVLDGLALVHRAGFIHRDIKPANLFIRDNGTPVLLDFGSARQAVRDRAVGLTSLVTSGYAPFEQYHEKGERQGPWTDIYALGASLYSAVTGELPVDAPLRGSATIDGEPDPYIPARRLGEGRYSSHFLQSIDWALRFREADRPQSVSDWVAALSKQAPVPLAEAVDTTGRQSGEPRTARPLLDHPRPTTLETPTARVIDDRSIENRPIDDRFREDEDTQVFGPLKSAQFPSEDGAHSSVAAHLDSLPLAAMNGQKDSLEAAPRRENRWTPKASGVVILTALGLQSVLSPSALEPGGTVESRFGPKRFSLIPWARLGACYWNRFGPKRWKGPDLIRWKNLGVGYWKRQRLRFEQGTQLGKGFWKGPRLGHWTSLGLGYWHRLGRRRRAALGLDRPLRLSLVALGAVGLVVSLSFGVEHTPPLTQRPSSKPPSSPVPSVNRPDQTGLRPHDLATVSQLLDLAEQDLRAARYTKPAGNNALERYSLVLALDGDNGPAREGLRQLVERFNRQSNAAIAAGQFTAARESMKILDIVEPESQWVRLARIKLAERQRSLSQRQQLDREAAQAKAKAEAERRARQYAENQARLKATQDKVNREKINQGRAAKAAELLALADADSAAKRLTKPTGRNALDRYRQVLAIDEHNPRAREALGRIAEYFIHEAEKALNDGHFGKSRELLNTAASVEAHALAVRMLQARLAERERFAESLSRSTDVQSVVVTAPEDVQNQEVQQLLARAARQMADSKLTEPPGDNAFETYQAVLSQQPENPEARAGTAKIGGEYQWLAQKRKHEGNWQTSLRMIDRGLRVIPRHAGLLALRDEVNTELAQQQQRNARRLATRQLRGQPTIDQGDAESTGHKGNWLRTFGTF